jgi:hypothetical protein
MYAVRVFTRDVCVNFPQQATFKDRMKIGGKTNHIPPFYN